MFSPVLSSAIAGFLFGAGTAFAQQLPVVVCSGLAGCGNPAENTIYFNIIPVAASLLIRIAAGSAVIFIVIAGVRMIVANAEDGKITAARKSILLALGGLGLALTSGNIVSFVTTEEYGQNNTDGNFLFGPFGLFASALNIVMVLFNVALIIMMIIAGIRMLAGQGSPDEFKKGGEVIKWCIIGAIVVNLAKVLVQAFLNLDL